MKRVITVLLVLLMAATLFAQGGSESQKSGAPAVLKFKLAENQPANNPISKGMLMFVDLVKEKTNGSVLIDVYLDAQRGTEN